MFRIVQTAASNYLQDKQPSHVNYAADGQVLAQKLRRLLLLQLLSIKHSFKYESLYSHSLLSFHNEMTFSCHFSRKIVFKNARQIFSIAEDITEFFFA